MPRVTLENVNEVFTYQPATEEQAKRYARIRTAMLVAAKAVLECCIDSRECSLAITALQEARMWANASIALEHIDD